MGSVSAVYLDGLAGLGVWLTMSRKGYALLMSLMVTVLVNPILLAICSMGPCPDSNTHLSWYSVNILSGEWDSITCSLLISISSTLDSFTDLVASVGDKHSWYHKLAIAVCEALHGLLCCWDQLLASHDHTVNIKQQANSIVLHSF